MVLRIISLVATCVLIGAVVALGVRNALVGTGPISLSLQLAALLLVLWARLTFGWRSFHFLANPTPGKLVTNGPYQYIRNPIYSGACIVIWTAAAMHWSVLNAGLALLATLTIVIRIYCEEQLLREAYPEYEAYARNTARLIPFVV
ncbi:MAG TPA: methyltransferase [Candidatus Angelobacter sp.]|nr:methyltransferase [Candidatus Angelobacter sp.]